MNAQQQRNKEDRLMESLKNPDNDSSPEISGMISHALKHGHVWLGTDWHLWLRYEKNKPDCHKRSDFNTILQNTRDTVKPDDLFVYLGDLVDGEFQNKQELHEALQTLHMNMILVKGNNDLFTDEFYRSCGFKYVVESFVYKRMLFTHVPVQNKYDLNIHGHLHSFHRYRIPYSNQIDVAWLGGRKEPVDMMDVIQSQPRYSKIVKVEPQHFDEHAIAMDVFNAQFHMHHVIEDPYHDDDD